MCFHSNNKVFQWQLPLRPATIEYPHCAILVWRNLKRHLELQYEIELEQSTECVVQLAVVTQNKMALFVSILSHFATKASQHTPSM